MNYLNWILMMNNQLMKTILFTLLTVFGIQVYAQTSTETAVSAAVMKAYNKKQYAAVYGFFNDEFKRTTTEDNIAGFLEYNIYDHLGRMKKVKYVRNDQGVGVYHVTFKGGVLEMAMAIDSLGKIAGLKFVPIFKEVTTIKGKQQAPLITNNKMGNELDILVDSLVRRFARQTALVGLSVGVVTKDASVMYGYGEVVKNTKQIPNAQTIFEIGSVTKTFTALLLAEAVSQNRINLDDDIRNHLKGNYTNLQFQGEPIRFRHLVNHTSGLPRLPDDLEQQPSYDEGDPYKNYSKEMILAYLHKVKLSKRPGTHSEYSNYGVALLGLLLESAMGRPYEELLTLYVYQPLGMKSTFANVPESLKKQMVELYDKNCAFVVTPWNLGDVTPAGGLKSTPEDMMAYMHGQLNNATQAIKLSHNQTYMESSGQGVAYGWMLLTLNNGDHLYWHNGATGGSTSFCAFIPERGVGIVILNNSNNSVDDLGMLLIASIK